MSRIGFMATLLTAATVVFGQAEGSVTTDKEAVADIIKKNFEISTNVFGHFIGFHTVAFELGLADGLYGLGLKLAYLRNPLNSGYTGIDVLAVGRFYPSLYRRGFYVAVQIGYTSYEFNNQEPPGRFIALPILTGVGFRWVINQFSLDLGVSAGFRVFLSSPWGDMNVRNFIRPNPDIFDTLAFLGIMIKHFAGDFNINFGFRF